MKVGSEGLIPKLREQKETGKGNAESQSQNLEKQIEHFTHGHPLSYYEIIEKNEDVLCKACTFEIYGQAYGCESCKYYLHNPCVKLSYEVLHPLHPQYRLDVKCFTSTEPNNEAQRLKEMARKLKLCPFQQDHKLFFFHFTQVKKYSRCNLCFLPISGLISRCFVCEYTLHESCLGFPPEMALRFHLEHPLHPILNRDICYLACRALFHMNVIIFNCRQYGDINLHLSCANSLWRALESKSDPHPLFYLGTEFQKLFANMSDKFFGQDIHFKCNKCNKSFSDVEEIVPVEEPLANLVSHLVNTSIQAKSEASTDESIEEQQSDDENPAMKE
ncbi:uncharacterized protein LOC110415618 [Herrania umbratica]|uniref:Uncharacterized protein LOC110415618 n=1 Tax=Herrania umbratica TaxID=108875 RepID=A0A6J1A820_9ROSI|nr:uncharacterized protein LOC110415618 [Herrania umbratica]